MGLFAAFKAFVRVWKDPKLLERLDAPALSPAPKKEPKEAGEPSHLRLLSLLQNSGRLIDFLKEDISAFDDAQVGAAVRQLHQQCGKCLEDVVTLRSIFEEEEGAAVQVPVGYDPSSLKITGRVQGHPPFQGVLRHKGWKACKRSLPKQVGIANPEIICPAEVEIR